MHISCSLLFTRGEESKHHPAPPHRVSAAAGPRLRRHLVTALAEGNSTLTSITLRSKTILSAKELSKVVQRNSALREMKLVGELLDSEMGALATFAEGALDPPEEEAPPAAVAAAVAGAGQTARGASSSAPSSGGGGGAGGGRNRLASLELRDMAINKFALGALLRSIAKASRLERLAITNSSRGGDVGNELAKCLGASLARMLPAERKLVRLRELVLEHCGVNDEGACGKTRAATTLPESYAGAGTQYSALLHLQRLCMARKGTRINGDNEFEKREL